MKLSNISFVSEYVFIFRNTVNQLNLTAIKFSVLVLKI